jgi:hypothetical protein
MRRKSIGLLACLLVLVGFAAMASPAGADFGFKELHLRFEEEDGSPALGAGTHPYAVSTDLFVNAKSDPLQGEVPDEQIKDLRFDLPPGLVGNPTAVPPCTSQEFATILGKASSCPDSSAVGVAKVKVALAFEDLKTYSTPVYNVQAPAGAAAQIGFVALGVPVTIVLSVNPEPPYNVIGTLTNIPQPVRFFGSNVSIWGNPYSPAHDDERGDCAGNDVETCPIDLPEKPFLTMPRSCTGPLSSRFETDSWQNPARVLAYPLLTDSGMEGCDELSFAPQISSEATTAAAGSSSGLNFNLDVADEGLTSVGGTAQSDIQKAVVNLPEGVTVNPSIANGLEVCTEGQFKAEAIGSQPGENCPQGAKVGEVEVETPLLEGKLLKGQVFVAEQNKNPFGSLLAIYMVIREPQLGILVKLPGRVTLDPRTGQLATTFGEAPYEIPQFPFSHLRFRFRGGARAPLVTPPRCGTYETKAEFYPWARPSSPQETTASFEVTSGPGGGPCPAAGPLPFQPGFQAGSVDNSAGSYSAFDMRLTRSDAEQELTRFDAVLPPGLTGKLAGLARCPEAAIAAAAAKSGREELASPSCPASSRIGHTLAGAGVGDALTYVPGSLYLAGPVAGRPLSIVSITPAVAGPFDVGTVVVREALNLNPVTAQVEVDGAASDPIPHILQGIPLKLRDLRVYADRPDFTLNPTSCQEKVSVATLFGSAADAFSPGDDAVSASDRFQAAGCAALAFKPKLSIRLKGGFRRAANPALTAVLTPRPGDANVGGATVILPHSAFLDQSHIGTICTRVQFSANQCPAGSVYGEARAWTPLLDEPLEGPVYLRANGGERELPDLVMALHGIVDVNVVGFVDSVNSRLRTRFLSPPDAPVSRLVLNMRGGKKGLIVNSTNICKGRNRATSLLVGQNGRSFKTTPQVQASCKGKRKGKGKRKVHSRR